MNTTYETPKQVLCKDCQLWELKDNGKHYCKASGLFVSQKDAKKRLIFCQPFIAVQE